MRYAVILTFVGFILSGSLNAIANENCISCHENSFQKGVHKNLECAACHQELSYTQDHSKNIKPKSRVSCGLCHGKVEKEFTDNCIHGKGLNSKNSQVPFCQDCHGTHSIPPLVSNESPLSFQNQPKTCGKCHSKDTLGMKNSVITKRKLLDRYYDGIHWKHVSDGKPAATCADCHSNHSILPSSNKGSKVGRIEILDRCAKCHENTVSQFRTGDHGRALLQGNLDVPNCTTCHGDHDIMSLRMQPEGKRSYSATQICMWCHGNERMMKRYNLSTTPVETYLADFHGLTQRGSGGASATCADCHDPHRALSHTKTESKVHISNREKTCGKCHENSGYPFFMSFTHDTHDSPDDHKVKRIVTLVYLILILFTIGGMLLHNAIIISFYIRQRLRQKHSTHHSDNFNLYDRIWHWILLLSFGALVFTGFALKYPNFFIFTWLYSYGFTEAIRAEVHRVSAIVMIADMALFFIYQIVSKKGYKWWKEMLPRLSDIRFFFQNMGYFLGLRKEQPVKTVFSYIEKAEYWALIWGTIIMLGSGLILWFPESIPSSWPSWTIEVATVVHLYEAILATLAIIVWHFFHVIFHPEHYPMDTSWIK